MHPNEKLYDILKCNVKIKLFLEYCIIFYIVGWNNFLSTDYYFNTSFVNLKVPQMQSTYFPK